MKIIVDADACPVKEIIINIGNNHDLKIIMVCDTSHEINLKGCQVVTVDKHADSADFKIVNMTEKNDIVVTQDYGLASMILAKNAFPINQNGMEYTSHNIDRLLFDRHINKKARAAGHRISHFKKRSKEDDEKFEKNLEILINKIKAGINSA